MSKPKSSFNEHNTLTKHIRVNNSIYNELLFIQEKLCFTSLPNVIAYLIHINNKLEGITKFKINDLQKESKIDAEKV